jgi:predicted 3-demethylubiquinone-9 3-methyltransferase (glyoxalase superfamily)
MSERTRPFLMFQGQAEEALRFYVSVIPDSEILDIRLRGAEGPGESGTVLGAETRIGGTTVMAFDSPVEHAFGFTPRISFFIEAASEAEIERLYGALAEGGQVLMELADHGFSRRFGWVNDRFGVSWQVNLA